MNSAAVILLIICGVGLLTFPRKWAPIPLLVVTCYMSLGQAIEIGPFNFNPLRIIALVGWVRVVLRGERLAGKTNSLDWLVIAWAVWAVISSIFHDDPNAALIFRLGMAYNVCCIYFLFRIFCQSVNDAVQLCRVLAILLLPVAVEMLYENMAFHNLFSLLGGAPEFPQMREDRIRSLGPFAHPILAGTVGAVCLPLTIGIWRHHRKESIFGIVACLGMIVFASSSGPIMSALAAIGALFMWRYRQKMQLVRWLAVVGYIGLDLVMKAPAYYIIWRFSVIGGSTGYHRARLIESAIEHIGEWWFAGTDYTRHWMETGVSWNPNYTDITNYYIGLGVTGGLPLMLLFIIILSKGFSFVGQILKQDDGSPAEFRFFIWALGSSLFAHAVSCIGVSYFDQSFAFMYLTLAVVSSIHSSESPKWTEEELKVGSHRFPVTE
jgi:hypothetical protein